MSGWKNKALNRIHELARMGRVFVTRKAVQELEDLDVYLQPSAVREVLLGLRSSDFVERVHSHHDLDWLYVFNPKVEGMIVYLKVAVRDECVVISFHGYQ